MTAIPTEAEVLEYFSRLSNWGRWGDDDLLGTLNLITADKRVQASRLVRLGRTVTCSWDLDTALQPDDVAGPPVRYMVMTGQGLRDDHRLLPEGILPTDRQAGVVEFLGLVYHGYRVTHIDALSHIFWDARMYNNLPAEWVTSSFGATRHAVTNIRDGIVTRGVLVDAARGRGVPWLEPGEFVTPDEVDAVLAATATGVGEGDAVLLRTGYGRRRLEKGADRVHEVGRAGWHASCLPWFHEHGVAFIGADTAQDVVPSGYDGVRIPIHAVGITAMGLWLLDNCNLEELARVCEELGTWEFEIVVAALPFIGATGSPVNPLAIF
jgi:kynurenine formamidase